MIESTREQIVDALQNGWGTCVARIQRLSPPAQATFLAQQGYDRLADLLAHVIGWWQEAQRAIENWLVDPTFNPPRHDVDAFNAQAVASVRNLDEPAVIAAFESARRALLAFVAGLPDEAFENQSIVERLQIEVVGHLEEHEMNRKRLSRCLLSLATGLIALFGLFALGACFPISPPHPPPDFPLSTGNTWVYSSTYYYGSDTSRTQSAGPQRITATYFITDSVVEVQMHVPYLVVQMLRQTTMITTANSSESLLKPSWDPEYTYWYVISGTQLYRQEKLDYQAVSASRLEYVFPLSAKNHWYPAGEQRELFPDSSQGPSSGVRIIQGPGKKTLPVGEFQDCYDVITMYLGGGTIDWFCPEIGPVGGQFDHVGTPFGYKTVLISYSIQSP